MSLKLFSKKSPLTVKTHEPGKLDIPQLGNKINFISLGCPRNLVDTEVMLGILLKNGYEITPTLEEADYIIVNTCGFLEASRQESLSVIEEVQKTKKARSKLIVSGCLVRSYKHLIQPDTVDYFLGSGDVESILEAIRSSHRGEKIGSNQSYLEAGEIPRMLTTPKHYAYLKIAEGCKKRCGYCVIPQIKGPLKSKSIEQVVKERDLLLKEGVKEIVLIAQDLGDFGKDRTTRHQSELYLLLKELLNTKAPYWLRLLYLYPDEITDELLDLMRQDGRLLPYLDMPIQHVNNDILKSMKRTTSKEQIISVIEKLQEEGVVIRTSLMVGYPGETEAQFNELLDFVREFPLDNVGVFKFSREPGSFAYDLPDQVSEEVKQERYERLVATQQEVLEEELPNWIGCQIPVLVENVHPESELLLRGRHFGQAPEVDGCVILNEFEKVHQLGDIYNVEITGVAGYDLIGKVV